MLISTTEVPARKSAEILRATQLTKVFNPGTGREHQALRGVDIAIERGRVTVIIGPSGSGKSTLLRTLNLIAPADSGEIQFGGTRCDFSRNAPRMPAARLRHSRAVRAWRAEMGMVFQSFNLFPNMSVLRNVALAPMRVRGLQRSEAEDIAVAHLSRLGLADKLRSRPDQLSGGQQQRVAIARSLAMSPQLMLFDEATSALDLELVGDVLKAMRELAEQGMTMVVVTHEIGFAREVGTHLVFMDAGRIVECGEPRSMLAAPTQPRLREFLSAAR